MSRRRGGRRAKRPGGARRGSVVGWRKRRGGDRARL